ncbi:MAG TPA: BTAD domain-containing putative transcriptional regulator, partial [Euzebyales bacterium]|nr:BTAD domain-containing putative transcriptional regulator [Euzebyales bacterium]
MQFRLLGPVEAWAGQRRRTVDGSQRRALLAMLLLHANRVVDVERLINVLWGSTPPRTARNSLQVRVSQLRRALAGDTAAERTARDRLVYRPPGYLLRVSPGELDWQRFQDLAGRGRQLLAAGDAEGASRLLSEALRLWRGRAMENVDVAALAEQRTRLEQRRLTALEDRFDADLRLGRHVELISELEALVAEQPLRERLCAQLMTALYRAGRQADALTVYRDVRRVLVREHGLEPGPELQRLEQAILTRAAALDLQPIPPRMSSSDTGARPARDVGAAAAPVPAQLPADLAEFTGRAEALAQLDTLSPAADAERPAAVKIAVITGPAGVGKTALAVHWAHRARKRFPDGQLHVDLQGYAPGPPLRPVRALARLLHGLGVEPDRIPVDMDTAAGMYRSLLAGRRVLVLLDNARDAGQVRTLLPGSPGCLVAITSRDRLAGLTATHGTSRLTLDTLSSAEAVTLLERIIGGDRAQAEPDTAADLAELCGRLPLALRIAAAHLACHPEWSIAGYVRRLRVGDQLGELAVDGDPHATVLGAFDCSYAVLEPDARRLFRLLGLVPGRPSARRPRQRS